MRSREIGLVTSALVAVFLMSPMMVFAEDFSVIIPQGASNRLCATFHNCYSPEEITISVGDSITWFNEDSDFHSVTVGGDMTMTTAGGLTIDDNAVGTPEIAFINSAFGAFNKGIEEYDSKNYSSAIAYYKKVLAVLPTSSILCK